MQRFDGNAAWHALNWADKNVIGGIALELVMGWIGQTYYVNDELWPRERAFDAAVSRLEAMLSEHVSELLRETFDPPSLPSLLGQVCRVCGCSEEDACATAAGPCSWAEPDLCTACASPALPAPEAA